MDEQKRISERERGALAEQILDNPLWAEAYEILTRELIEAWRATVATQTDEREKIYLMLMAVDEAFRQIESVFNTGKMAEREIEDKRNGRTTSIN